ncbi:hypothetical protein ABT246_25700 [Streptomyces sp. NPDC001553]|uniref:hypothetical protein n=1 Tax=Streptomyces sp. NPDC001553 TaxID=3154385 RepID=UPI003333575A
MYAMRIVDAYTPAFAELVGARMDWQLARGQAVSGEVSALIDLVRLGGIDPGTVVVGMWDDTVMVAAFMLQVAAPREGWTDAERAESSMLVLGAHTHPDHRGLARLITPWVCDYAARLPAPPAWVRCTVRFPAIARHLEQTCGWEPVRDLRNWQGGRHLFQRRPQLNDSLGALIRGEGPLALSCGERDDGNSPGPEIVATPSAGVHADAPLSYRPE